MATFDQPLKLSSQGDINRLPNEALGPRNAQIQQLLAMIYGPDFGMLAATGGRDQAAQQFQTGKQAAKKNIQARGLTNSGATPNAALDLQTQYGENVTGQVANAATADQQRKLQLLASLLGISVNDLGTANKLSGVSQQQFGLNVNQGLQDLQNRLDLAHGAAVIASIIAGGAAGGAGVAGGAGGAAGAGTGALQGYQFSQQFGGGGGGSGLINSMYPNQQPSGPPTANYAPPYYVAAPGQPYQYDPYANYGGF